jgi:hypothetical protein
MMPDIFDDPETRAWAQRAVDELLPMIADSALNVSIVPDEAGVDDIKFALELGLSIMLDKPIILAVAPGRHVPAHLARVADSIVEYDLTDQASTGKRLGAAIAHILGDES